MGIFAKYVVKDQGAFIEVDTERRRFNDQVFVIVQASGDPRHVRWFADPQPKYGTRSQNGHDLDKAVSCEERAVVKTF